LEIVFVKTLSIAKLSQIQTLVSGVVCRTVRFSFSDYLHSLFSKLSRTPGVCVGAECRDVYSTQWSMGKKSL